MTKREIYMEFRTRVMEWQDACYEQCDGETPDHMIVSDEMWEFLDETHKFEQLKNQSNPKRPGFLGMKVWHSGALDEREKHALLLSEDVFDQVIPKVYDHKGSRTRSPQQ